MSAEGLLTLFGLVLTVYTVVSPERRLEMRIRLGLFDWLLIGACLAAVHYILLFPVLDSLGLAPALGPWRYGFTPETASYTIIAGTTTIVWLRATMRPIPLRRIPALRELLERLLEQRRFAEVTYVLQRHLNRLQRAVSGDLVSVKLRKALCPSPVDLFLEAHREEQATPWYRNKVTRAFARMLPTHERPQIAATDLMRRLLAHEPFVADMASVDPYFGLGIVRAGLDPYKDFQALWIAALLNDRHSVLYYEIQDNQVSDGAHRYRLLPSNRLLSFYFSDPHVAEKEAIYKPCGDFVHSYLDQLLRDKENDPYNQPLDDFYETGRWRDPVHAVLRMFDFMIPESMHAGIAWHMWLFYLPSFVDKCERNLQVASTIDEGKEWPTPYHYFLYEAVSCLRNWYDESEELEANNPNRGVGVVDLSLDVANITKSAALALGEVCATIFGSYKLLPKFKAYILEVALRDFNHVSPRQPLSDKQRLLLASISNGGGRYVSDRAAHRERVRSILADVDPLLRCGVEESLFSYVES